MRIGSIAGEGWGTGIDLVLEKLLPLPGLIFDIRGNGVQTKMSDAGRAPHVEAALAELKRRALC